VNTIAVITRTKNRPYFLNRVLEHLLKQSFKEFTWVIVNDAGDRKIPDVCCEVARKNNLDANVIHLTKALGRAGAANEGVENSNEPFIHIHDDDDTLEPRFYEKMVSILKKNSAAVASTCGVTRIVEYEKKANWHTKTKTKLDLANSPLPIFDLAYENKITTIGTLFRRVHFDTIGGFDRSLPVLEDWDLWLRLIQIGDFLLHPEYLANYHIRPVGKDKGMDDVANSKLSQHIQVERQIRNKYLRDDLKSGAMGMGWALNLHHRQTLNRLDALLARLSGIKNRFTGGG